MDEPMFAIRRTASSHGARIGRMVRPGRKLIETPTYIASTSRGTVPHLTSDTLARSTLIDGVYASMEDFVEKASQHKPPVCSAPGGMRSFITLPSRDLLVVGSRRSPPIIAPPATSNTKSSIAVCTSTGFQYLEAEAYAQYTEELDADVVCSLADVPYGRSLASRRIETATDRSIEWLQYHLQLRRKKPSPRAALFASLLPVPNSNQQYFTDLVEENKAEIDGLAIYNISTLDDLPPSLQELPRLGLTEAKTPLQALDHLSRGVDILVVPFIDSATDAGLALDFEFAGQALSDQPSPLAVDMWSTEHATAVAPLAQGCTCYACRVHHRAYIHHLLMAKEMLGWALLQIHNHNTIDKFFAKARESIAHGTFTEDVEAFSKQYEPELPQKTGQGPRVRGYQRKSEGKGEPKANQAAFVKYQASVAGKALAAKKETSTKPTVDALDLDLDLGLLEVQDENDVQDLPDPIVRKNTVEDGPVV